VVQLSQATAFGSTCWNWPPSLIGNDELDYFAQFCAAKRQRKAVNYFFGFDKEPQRHKMPFTKYSILIDWDSDFL